MTDKQNIFVQEYLKDCNATQAAIRAGYSEHTAYSIGQRLMKDISIQEAIRAGMDDRKERSKLTADYVIDNLREIAERCMQKSPVMVKGEQATDEEGRHIWTFDAKNAIRALELLGKHMAMFTDKVNVQNDNEEAIYQRVIRAEILKHAQEQEQEQATA